MTRMQAARVFAKRRAKYRQQAAIAFGNGDGRRANYYLVASCAMNDAWHDLNAAWDSEEA